MAVGASYVAINNVGLVFNGVRITLKTDRIRSGLAYLGVLVTSIRILGSKTSAIDEQQPPVLVESKISQRFPRTTTDIAKPFVAGITEQIALAIRLCTIFVPS